MNLDLLHSDFKSADKIRQIVLRLREMVPTLEFDALQLDMDLTVCHNVAAVDLDRLLFAPSYDFLHDIGGIAKHLDRQTGKLGDCFWPRCAPSREAHAPALGATHDHYLKAEQQAAEALKPQD